MDINKCEWCGTEYPEFDKTVEYYELWLFGKEYHVICSDCKKHLKLIKINNNPTQKEAK